MSRFHRPPRKGAVPLIAHGIDVSLYEDRLPSSIWPELDRLYESLYSSELVLRAGSAGGDVRACVAREGGVTRAIFLFRRKGARIDVLNEMIEVEARWINAFAACVFERYRRVRRITFKGVRTDMAGIDRRHQCTPFVNDVVLELPESEAAYQAALGRSTRENLKRHLKTIRRDFPSFRFDVNDSGDAGNEARIRRIIELSHARLASKGKVSGISAAEQERIVARAREGGMLATIAIDGEVCAGVILFRIGSAYFLRMIAHDNAYNKYSLGMLCCYLAIGECIRRGGTRFHFLFGRQIYKYRLHGEDRNFDRLTLYRAWPAALLDMHVAAGLAIAARMRRLRDWWIDPRHHDYALVRLARMFTHALRKRKWPGG